MFMWLYVCYDIDSIVSMQSVYLYMYANSGVVIYMIELMEMTSLFWELNMLYIEGQMICIVDILYYNSSS